MYQFTIQVAGLNIGITTIWKRLMIRARDYLTNEKPDFCVRSSQEEIDLLRYSYTVANNETDPLDRDIEMALILTKIADELEKYNIFLMHGTVVAVNGLAYMFTAPSGTGKSTHVYKWLKHVPGAYVVNGDKPFVIAGEVPMVCGTPWAGKEGWQTNISVPLKAIVLMNRSYNNQIREIPFREAFARLLQQTHKPNDLMKLNSTLHLLNSISSSVKFYHFDFNNFLPDAFEVSYQALVGNKES